MKKLWDSTEIPGILPSSMPVWGHKEEIISLSLFHCCSYLFCSGVAGTISQRLTVLHREMGQIQDILVYLPPQALRNHKADSIQHCLLLGPRLRSSDLGACGKAGIWERGRLFARYAYLDKRHHWVFLDETRIVAMTFVLLCKVVSLSFMEY